MHCAEVRLLVLRFPRTLHIILGLPDASGPFQEMFFSLWEPYPPPTAYLLTLSTEAMPSTQRDLYEVVTLDRDPYEQHKKLIESAPDPCFHT